MKGIDVTNDVTVLVYAYISDFHLTETDAENARDLEAIVVELSTFGDGLPLRDSGFDSSVLCEFRARLVSGGAERLLFDAVLDLARSRDLVRARGW